MALTVGISCAAVLLLLIATPIHVHVAVARDRSVKSRVRVSWLFGLVRARVHPRFTRARPTPDEEQPTRRRRKRGAWITRRVGGGLLRPEFRARLVAFLRDVLLAIRPRDLRFHARIGMDDPADTGQLWAVLGPLGVLLSSRGVWLEPDFEEACLRFEARTRVRLIPAQLIFLAAAFLVSPPVVRVLVAR